MMRLLKAFARWILREELAEMHEHHVLLADAYIAMAFELSVRRGE